MGQTTNIDESSFDFRIFPNPTIGSFNISFNDNEYHTVEIYDNNGRIVSKMKKYKQEALLNISQYPSGTYTIKVMPESVIYQIVKQ